MDIKWISDKLKSDFVCFPVDNEIATVCQCIRFWIAKNRSFYVGKDNNILIRFNLKDFKGDL